MPEFFKIDYGVDYKDFNRVYPTADAYLKSHLGKYATSEEYSSFSTDDAQLRSMLVGPLDIIESALLKAKYRGRNDIPRSTATIRDAERMTGRYTYPEDHPLNHPVRRVREIVKDYNRYYGRKPIVLPKLKLKRKE